jgi:ribosomal protein S1
VEISPGLDALLQISEIADRRVSNVHEVLKEGEQISVKIIKIEGGKISVSSKALGRP